MAVAVLLGGLTFMSVGAGPADAGDPGTYCAVVLDGPYHSTWLWNDHARANAVAGCTWPVGMTSDTDLKRRIGWSYSTRDSAGGGRSYRVAATDSVSERCDGYGSTYMITTSWIFSESPANTASLAGAQTNWLSLC